MIIMSSRFWVMLVGLILNLVTIQSFTIDHNVRGRHAATTFGTQKSSWKSTTKTTSSLAFQPPKPTSTTRLYETQEQEKGVFEFLADPFPTKIPKEMREEIYKAEGNTPAAKERTQRVVVYVIIALAFIGLAFFNAFLTEVRDLTKPEVLEQVAQMQNIPKEEVLEVKLSDIGFGWVESNPITKFVLMNKLGGGIVLVAGAGAGILAEAELDSRRQNAERIWEELERRRNESSSKSNKKKKKNETSKKKKRMSGKERKRQQALSEVVLEDEVSSSPPVEVEEKEKVDVESSEQQEQPPKAKEEERGGGGVFGKIKDFYDKADSMAASQALLLNKELEDRGIVDKITDESGLKVIGKEAAEKLEKQKTETDNEEKK